MVAKAGSASGRTNGSAPRKVLLVQTAFIGDVVFTSPLVHAIKKAYPQTGVGLLVDPRSREVAACIPGVDEILSFDKRHGDRGLSGLLQVARRVRRSGYDLLVSPHRSARTSLLALLSRIPLRVGYRSGLGRLAYHLRVPRRGSEPCDLMQDAKLLEPLGIRVEDTRLRLSHPPGLEQYVKNFFHRHGLESGDRLVGLCIGAYWESKRWPAVYFASLAEALKERGMHPVLFGGPAETNVALQVAEARHGPLVSCVGNRLEESAALLSRCDAAVGGDSGLTHIARALGVPTVIIYGPTDPRSHRFEEHTRVLTASVPCRPCSRHGPRRCPKGHHDCMRLVSPENVMDALRQLGNFKTPPPRPAPPARTEPTQVSPELPR